MTSDQPARTRRRRWWKVALALLLFAVVSFVALLPSMLTGGPGRRWLLSRANRLLAPGHLDVASFHFSWFGATRLDGVVLTDRDKTRVIDASRVRWDRTLVQILCDAPRLGTLVLERPALDVERKPDGTINLYETLKPLLADDPKLDLKVVVRQGRLAVRGAGLLEPVLAEQADVTVDLAAAPRPLAWRAELAHDAGAGRVETLSIQGRWDRWNPARGTAPDVAIRTTAHAWPWTLDGPGLAARGRLHGALNLDRHDGRWVSTAQARIQDLDAFGPRLAADHLRLDEVAGIWDVSETADGWDVRRLDVTAPIGTLHAAGALAETGRIDGTLDIAALARELPHALGLRDGLTLEKGSAVLAIAGRKLAEGHVWDVEARLSDVRARDSRQARVITLKTPATLTARVTGSGTALAVERLSLASDFLNVQGRGDVDRGLSIDATFDLAALQRQLDEVVDFGPMRLSGQGRVTGRYRRNAAAFDGSLEGAVHGLHVEGVGPTLLARDSAELRMTAQGPATSTGLPAALATARATFVSGTSSAELNVTRQGDATVWNASAHASTRLGDRDVEARAVIAARAQTAAVALERVELTLTPQGHDPLVVRARGAVDRRDGTITLAPPSAGGDGDAVRLAPDGITIRGLGSPHAFRAAGAFTGDVAKTVRLFAPEAAALRGTWTGRATALAKGGGVHLAAQLAAHDLSDDIEGPVSLSVDALTTQDSDRVEVSELALSSRYVTVETSGRLRAGRDGRQLTLRGTVAPGWEAIRGLAARRIDPSAQLTGKPGTLALEADLSDLSVRAILRSLAGEAGFELGGAKFFGMRVGGAPVVLRAGQGKLWVAPIETTINEGRLHLEPRFAFDDADGLALVLGPESTVRDAAINDEVSHRVLSFVAPVLESATRVRGRVSVDVEDAEFPLGGGERAHATVDGRVTFQDVEFVAGGFVDDLLAMVGREPKAILKLNKPVSLVVADGRIQTEGLALPLGNVTEIAFDGWVDFDRRMNMTASLPVTRKMMLGVDFLGDIVDGTKIRVPIGGTVDHPELDRGALKLGLQDLGKTLLERTAGRGAAELLMRLARPPDRNAPPRLTPAERRARRRNQRMQRDGLVPPGNE